MSDIIRPKIPRPNYRPGKGSKRRPEAARTVWDNWDSIRWDSKPKRSLTRRHS
jgi:hypothetical protein